MHRPLAFAALGALALGSLALPRAAHAAELLHEGFFARIALGIGGATASSGDNPEVSLRGGAGFLSLDLGASVSRRLVLHARLAGCTVVEPTVYLDGDEIGDLDRADLSFSTLGLGLTYYTRTNLYLTAVIGFSRATLEVDDIEADSSTGLSLMGDLGYEWPVSHDWGLGLAGRIEFHSIPNDGERLGAGALALLFSATYN